MNTPALPPSETRHLTNLFATACGLGTAWFFCRATVGLSPFYTALAVLIAAALPILLSDLCFRRARLQTAAGLTASRPANPARIAIKCLGMAATLAIFALLYWALPVYRDPFYQPAWRLLQGLVPLMLLATPFYFTWCDRRLATPEDGYYHLGRLLLMRKVSLRPIAIHLRHWLVKAFFLPLMFVYLTESLAYFQGIDRIDLTHPTSFYTFANSTLYLVDLLFATVGYIMTLRIVNAHIRSSEPTFLGWAAAIACYAPFWSLFFYTYYFTYDPDGDFLFLLANRPTLLWAVSIAILLLISIYSWATIAMGYRFSNLTYRGLVTCGPYRFCKHPAYVAKNISWWLIALPFLSLQGADEAIRNCLLLLGVNTLYVIRARTEERHLSNFPEYVAYAEAMNTRSIFAPLAKHIPALRYTRPAHPPRID